MTSLRGWGDQRFGWHGKATLGTSLTKLTPGGVSLGECRSLQRLRRFKVQQIFSSWILTDETF